VQASAVSPTLAIVGAGAKTIAVAANRTLHADGLMITGPGQPERSILSGNPRVMSIAEFGTTRHSTNSSPRIASR
jgi:hypothetical protein